MISKPIAFLFFFVACSASAGTAKEDPQVARLAATFASATKTFDDTTIQHFIRTWRCTTYSATVGDTSVQTQLLRVKDAFNGLLRMGFEDGNDFFAHSSSLGITTARENGIEQTIYRKEASGEIIFATLDRENNYHGRALVSADVNEAVTTAYGICTPRKTLAEEPVASESDETRVVVHKKRIKPAAPVAVVAPPAPAPIPVKKKPIHPFAAQ